VLSARYRVLLQYRAAALAGAGTQLFWGGIRIMILLAFYRGSSSEQPMEPADVVTYVWLGQALLALLPWNHDLELERQVRDGGVAYELLRPLDLYAYWSMRTLARRISSTSLRCVPIVVVAGVVLPWAGLEAWRLAPPDGLAAGALFAVAMLVAIALGCAITMLVHVSLLFTISGDGVARLMPALVTIFSGMVVPLPLFPDWAQPFLALLPFPSLADVPYRVYTGDIPTSEALPAIAFGALWTAVLVASGRWLLARGQRALVVQGG
jgi:ABC-2 type transport system permease protein